MCVLHAITAAPRHIHDHAHNHTSHDSLQVLERVAGVSDPSLKALLEDIKQLAEW